LHSLINLISRKRGNGDIYYQARFYDKSGELLKSKSYHDTKSYTKAYSLARQELENGVIPSITKEDIKAYGLLTLDEVKEILNMKTMKPELLRANVIVLLGATCGLGVSEVQNLRYEDIIFERDMMKIDNGTNMRIIPIIKKMMDKIKELRKIYPDSLYVIKNQNNIKKPCNPTTISRGLSYILEELKIPKERNIVFSFLNNNFLSLLLSINTGKNIPFETIDSLCGFAQKNSNINDLGKEIEAMRALRFKLEDLQYNIIGDNNWLNRN
jgi:integrase